MLRVIGGVGCNKETAGSLNETILRVFARKSKEK
jgi:hypothetical protein